MPLAICHLISFFFIYGFLGWCTEVCFQALSKGKLVNRGFLSGAICPIYGVGVVLVVWILEPLAFHGLILFVGSVVLCSFLEWFTGIALEKIFHQKWWDYSREPFNIGGYICLRFSILWGLACVFVIYMIHPTIVWLVELIPNKLLFGILIILGTAFVLDCAATIKTMLGFNKELRRIDEEAEKLRKLSDDLTEKLYENSIKAKSEAEHAKEEIEEWKRHACAEANNLKSLEEHETLKLKELAESEKKALNEHKQELQEELAQRLTRSQRRLLKAFPNVHSTKYAEAMKEVKLRLEKHMK